MGESEGRWGVDEVHAREVMLGGRRVDVEARLASSGYFLFFQQEFRSDEFYLMKPIYLGGHGGRRRSRRMLLRVEGKRKNRTIRHQSGL